MWLCRTATSSSWFYPFWLSNVTQSSANRLEALCYHPPTCRTKHIQDYKPVFRHSSCDHLETASLFMQTIGLCGEDVCTYINYLCCLPSLCFPLSTSGPKITRGGECIDVVHILFLLAIEVKIESVVLWSHTESCTDQVHLKLETPRKDSLSNFAH